MQKLSNIRDDENYAPANLNLRRAPEKKVIRITTRDVQYSKRCNKFQFVLGDVQLFSTSTTL